MALTLPLDIVNAACAVFGDEPLQSLEDDVVGGQAAALLYQSVVDFNLGLYPWSFGRQIFQLSTNSAATAWTGYTNVFDLPPERLEAPIYLTDDVSNPDRRFSDFTLEGDRAHATADALWAMCKFSPAPHLWSATFRHATITALASSLARARAHDKVLSAKLLVEAYGSAGESFRGGMMRTAMSADAYGTPPRKQDRDTNPLTLAWRS